MIDTTLLLHANALYAEVPFKNIPIVVEKSYIPVLKTILKTEGLKLVLDFSGFTLELLNGEYPELFAGSPECLDIIKEGILLNKLELTGSSWSHAVLPLMPAGLIKEDLRLYLKTIRRILNYTPSGFFPPELGISPLLPALLKEAGYEYVFFDRDFLDFTINNQLNNYNEFETVPVSLTRMAAESKRAGVSRQLAFFHHLDQHLEKTLNFKPVIWQGATFSTNSQEAQITAIPCDSAWVTYSIICFSEMGFLSVKKLIKKIKQIGPDLEGLFLPYSSDIEFYGYGGNTYKDAIPVSRLADYLSALSTAESINLVLPSEYLAKSQPQTVTYLKSGSWSSSKDFSLWTSEADNQLLNNLCAQAAKEFLNPRRSLLKIKNERVLKTLLLAYNSDGRGWTPLAEHRLFCLNKALEAHKALKLK